MTPDIPVRRYADLSAAHLERRANDALALAAGLGEVDPAHLGGLTSVTPTGFGFWVGLPDPDDLPLVRDDLERAFGRPFAALVARLVAAGVDRALFDRDGPEVPGLPAYDW